MRKLKWLLLYSLISITIIQLISFGISNYYDFSMPDTLFMVGLAVFMIGLLFSMQGRSFLGNKFIPEDTNWGAHDVSVFEAERESQEIRTQGTIKYTIENRIMRFRIKPLSLMISGVVSLMIAYFLS